jgi:hypothetical protein
MEEAMKRAVFGITIVGLFLTLSSTPLLADECDPSKILIKDSDTQLQQEKTNVDEDSSINAQQEQGMNSAGSGNYLDVLSGSGNLNAKLSKAMAQKFGWHSSDEYLFTETYLNLSDNARNAYADCLRAKTQHLFLYPALNIMEADDTSVVAELETYVVPIPVKLSVSVDGATLESHQPKTIILSGGGKAIIRIKRGDGAFTVYAHTANEDESLPVPAKSLFKYVREIRYSQSQIFGHPANGYHDIKDICVQLQSDDDAVIIPDSAVFAAPLEKVSQGGQLSDTLEAPYDPSKVCRRIDAHDDGTHKVDIRVCGYVMADVMVRIPVNASESKYGAEPRPSCPPH